MLRPSHSSNRPDAWPGNAVPIGLAADGTALVGLRSSPYPTSSSLPGTHTLAPLRPAPTPEAKFSVDPSWRVNRAESATPTAILTRMSLTWMAVQGRRPRNLGSAASGRPTLLPVAKSPLRDPARAGFDVIPVYMN